MIDSLTARIHQGTAHATFSYAGTHQGTTLIGAETEVHGAYQLAGLQLSITEITPAMQFLQLLPFKISNEMLKYDWA